MAVLSSKQVLQDKNITDPSAITSLTLTHKALSDVSCLSDFKNLERLDLAFNSLTSLEDLEACANLKWLSVVQNKLQSLKGIEGLTKLTKSSISGPSGPKANALWSSKPMRNNTNPTERVPSTTNLEYPFEPTCKRSSLEELLGFFVTSSIKGLSVRLVLNAGKNKLRSVDEIRSIVSLRALILNDNEIVSVCRLDPLKELNTLEGKLWNLLLNIILASIKFNPLVILALNTLDFTVLCGFIHFFLFWAFSAVLSRNPIREIGESLFKVKTITKLSLSNCQLQTIDSSLKSCTELKELRLAHNDIECLPEELALNIKIQNLDLGNNGITRWSDLKVLSSLVNLRNLNLQGNPIAETEKLAKKVMKLVPNLQIYNARPIDKTLKNEKGGRVDGTSPDDGNKPVVQIAEETNQSTRNKRSKHHVTSQNKQDHLDNAGDFGVKEELNQKIEKRNETSNKKKPDTKENILIMENKVKKKLKTAGENDDGKNPYTHPDMQQDSKRKKQKRNDLTEEKVSEISKKPKKVKQNVFSLIDDGEIPLMDLFTVDDTAEDVEISGENEMVDNKSVQDVITKDGSASSPLERKKIKKQSMGSADLQMLAPAAEVGLGGPSTWDT
ncbi:hypothetical protein RJ640_007304 [Escallonia rubra]|uniref:Uncharacterized protein n=1 Tax=Escallonia rubra TaxID=112253 RepID=A0AA88RF17_9ASTE|nr:hypothetical protein RJ640_007304 [Escallonia rubra]